MNPKSLTFSNSDGINLSAHLYMPLDREPKFYAIFAHCFTCSKNFSAVSRISKSLSQEGVAVFSFDFTGLGRSEGDFKDSTFSSNISDLLDAAAFLKENYEAPKMLIGHSLGGAAVLYASPHLEEVSAVVTLGAPADPLHVKHLFQNSIEEIEESGKAKVFIGGRPFQISSEFVKDLEKKPINSFLKKLKKSLLILHSPQDEIVEIKNAQMIYEAAFHPKSFVSLDGADHLVSKTEDAAYIGQVIASWSNRYIESKQAVENDTKGNPVMVRLSKNQGYTTDVKTPFHHLIADEPKDVGGNNLGPTPYDLLMASLGTCTAMTLKMYAERKKWNLDEVRVYLDHQKVHKEDSENTDEPSAKVSRFTRVIELEGDLNQEERQRLLEIANRCPVHRTLEEDIVIHTVLSK
ncbi:putative redox protein [Algoriphagus ornithinivorans]|uniref:Putative redox protein n=1 Tax=Algoriphagus ornithinivorans TaxID=226506 RepID=A0A1I5H346_9BACT|nr:alpha/beta fold hydrolase [Algoriphagus ornithinivorans]SFO42241.1 putative redox protein [Algoriphagus ornithinivorans]